MKFALLLGGGWPSVDSPERSCVAHPCGCCAYFASRMVMRSKRGPAFRWLLYSYFFDSDSTTDWANPAGCRTSVRCRKPARHRRACAGVLNRSRAARSCPGSRPLFPAPLPPLSQCRKARQFPPTLTSRSHNPVFGSLPGCRPLFHGPVILENRVDFPS